jgi:hypothetical protein
MVKKFFIFVAVLSVIGAGYFTYEKWIKDADLSLWTFVPENSLFVYESDQLATTLNHLREQAVIKNLSSIASVRALDDDLFTLDSILAVENGFQQAFAKTPFLISTHKISNDELDVLYVVRLNNIGQQSALNTIQTGLLESGWQKKRRTYLDYTITELYQTNGATFTYLMYKNYFMGSRTAFLVEDAIRTFEESEYENFAVTMPELYGIAKLEQDQGNLYVNMRRIGDFIQTISNTEVGDNFARSSFLDIAVEDNITDMTGFTYAAEEDYLYNFSGIMGSEFDLAEIVSNETAVLFHYSFSEADSWRKSIDQTLGAMEKNRRMRYIEDADFDVTYLYTLLEQEVAAGQYGENQSPFLLLELGDSGEAFRFLKESSSRYLMTQDDSLYLESFSDYQLLKVPFRQLPSTLLGSNAGSFDDCFFTTYRNYGIFTSSLPVLKQILEDIEVENTWSKSLRKNRFLQRANQEAVYSIYVDIPNAWRSLKDILKPEWKSIVEKNEYVFRNFQNLAIQFNPVDNKFYANILLEQNPTSNLGEYDYQIAESLNFGAPITTKPYIVRNHNTNLFESVVQDSANQLFLIGSDFEALWSKGLEGPLQGEVVQLDYYRNQKLQMAFVTDQKLHIIDRTSAYLPGFPVEISGLSALKYFEVVDYDGSKNYRYAIADDDGKVALTDKDGNPLDGWNPKDFKVELACPVRHYRIGGTDVFLVVLTNGEIHLLSRRGRNFPGFPLKLNENVKSDYFIKEGSNFASTEVTVIAESGLVTTFNLKGDIQNRLQLIKSKAETRFGLLKDVGNKNFLISQSTDERLTILSKDGTRLFEKDYLNTQSPFVQYYRISSSQQYVIVGERKGEYIYIYDLNGRLITRRPIAGNNPVSMIYYERLGELQVYVADQDELKLTKVKN